MKNVMKRVAVVVMTMAMLGSFVGCSATKEASSDVLRVGMECGYAPYNWTQSDDSNGAVPIADSTDYANGYDVMMAKYLAEEMGVELEIYKIDWDSLPVAVQSGAIDAVVAGQSITSERLETVDFTTPYYYASVVALTRGDTVYADATSVADLDGATASSQINTIWYDVALPQIPNVNALPAMESAPAMIVALQSGAIDIVVTDMPTATAACVADPSLKVLAFEGDGAFEVSDEDVNIGISTQKGNDELTDQLNEALAKLTEADFIEMMDDAIAVQPLSE
ncbi:MAG: transporter substrate-binding domain-containing protein [Lachnospiraceae bacterium]